MTSSSFRPPISELRKSRHKKGKTFCLSHMAFKWQNRDRRPGTEGSPAASVWLHHPCLVPRSLGCLESPHTPPTPPPPFPMPPTHSGPFPPSNLQHKQVGRRATKAERQEDRVLCILSRRRERLRPLCRPFQVSSPGQEPEIAGSVQNKTFKGRSV